MKLDGISQDRIAEVLKARTGRGARYPRHREKDVDGAQDGAEDSGQATADGFDTEADPIPWTGGLTSVSTSSSWSSSIVSSVGSLPVRSLWMEGGAGGD
jgi:hypothetical protein